MGWFKKIGNKIKKGVKKITKKVPILKSVGKIAKKFVTPLLSKIPVVGSVIGGVSMLKGMFNKKSSGTISTETFNKAYGQVTKQYPKADIGGLLKQEISSNSGSARILNSSGRTASYMPYSSNTPRITSSFDFSQNRGFDNDRMPAGSGVYDPDVYDNMSDEDKKRVAEGKLPLNAPSKSNDSFKTLGLTVIGAIILKKFNII